MKNFFSNSLTSVSISTMFHNATEFRSADPEYQKIIDAKREALKKDIATIDSLDLTPAGKADMLIRLAAWQSVDDQSDKNKKAKLSIPDNMIEATSQKIKNGEKSEIIIGQVQVELMLKSLLTAKKYQKLEEEKPKELNFPL